MNEIIWVTGVLLAFFIADYLISVRGTSHSRTRNVVKVLVITAYLAIFVNILW